MKDKIYKLEERLVEFAGEVILMVIRFRNDEVGKYFKNQMIRSSSGSALNYGEAQGTETKRDFVHKMSLVLKELKETRVSLKILSKISYQDKLKRSELILECEELIAISATMIKNKRTQQ